MLTYRIGYVPDSQRILNIKVRTIETEQAQPKA